MTPLHWLVGTPFAEALGWTLVHSLWEGTVAALLLAAGLAVLRTSRARYAAACTALLAAAAGFAATFAVVMPAGGPGLDAATNESLRAGGGFASAAAAFPLRLEGLLPWLAPLWIGGVLLFHLRAIAAWSGARRLRSRGVCLAPVCWQDRLGRLREHVGVRRAVELFESSLTGVPVVIGYLRPVILVPAGLLAGMPAEQLEAILLHELAHIRRGDYLVNVAQTIIEGFLFYHPAVWWISRVIRSERENCCDDAAVEASGSAYEYARALAALERMRCDQSAAAMAATGGNLVKRVRRLLDRPETSAPAAAPALVAGVALLAAAGMLTAWQANQAADSPYTRWMTEDVVYIITPAERAAFERLKSDEERDHFIEQFWQQRDPTPGTPANEFKMEHYRRIAYANQRFASRSGVQGWRTDRGRIYVLYGPPDEIESHPMGNGADKPYGFEAWRYRSIKGIGSDVVVEFADRSGTGDYRMTADPHKVAGRD